MNKFGRPLENIFKDRRVLSEEGDRTRPTNCRRRHGFDKTDRSPWWLKVNYVNMDLKLVGNDNRDE